ncbi:MAG TPA: universal stress protein [Blastocatellia bacterium]|nr:universal stress protein [Blastocatellia bacterium]
MAKNERINIERILYPTDPSPPSNDAFEYAVALARSYGAKLLLCSTTGSQPAYVASEDARRLFGEMMAKINTDTAAPLDWKSISVEGDTATEVARVAAEQRIDLVVTHSRKDQRAATLLDSTAEAISRTAPCPVLITPQRHLADATPTGGIGFKRILVAYDFSGDSELALTYGLSLAQEFQSELHLIHVLSPVPKAVSQEADMALATPERVFHATAKLLHNAVPAEAHLWSEVKQVVSQGLPYREILAYARENEIDLICIGASGAGFGLWALFGSNTDRILRQAACPVLIARPLRSVAQKASFTANCQAAS